MRSQADALVDATHGSRWTGIVTYMLCASLLGGCANIVPVAASAKNTIGQPIAIWDGSLERREITEPGSIRWSLNHRYVLDGNLRVFPHPPEWGCSTEYIVNSADVIIGFNLVGDGCSFHKGELW
ncbi:MAG: hypothetical protein R3F27_11705 [Gammaproteobacteria bacterium]